jgi:hypothetical protein
MKEIRKAGKPLRRDLRRLIREEGESEGNPAILIVCEGKKTEPLYFNGLAKRLLTVDVVQARGTDPVSIVKDAAEQKKRRLKESYSSTTLLAYEHVWCVFDVDAHPNLENALATAKDNGIRVALSNPCFEYWLLLHFVRFATNLTRFQAERELRKNYLHGYDKGKDYNDQLFHRIDCAIENIKHILKSQWHIDGNSPTEVLGCCPSTSVHLLVELLRAPVCQ